MKIACVQLSSGQNLNDNIARVSKLIRMAKSQGADIITTPENVALMDHRDEIILAHAEPISSHSILKLFTSLARELEVFLLIGSVPLKTELGKITNCSILINPVGGITAKYNKIHLFDANLPSGETYRESDTFYAGKEAVVAKTPWCKIGMTICYDLRFGSLYRILAKRGALIITVPAAFTKITGQAHWHVLLRSRAIEYGVFIVAPGMWGEHSGGRQTYGHSLIVDPWGRVLADAGEGEKVIFADIDLSLVNEAREHIPSLDHKEFS